MVVPLLILNSAIEQETDPERRLSSDSPTGNLEVSLTSKYIRDISTYSFTFQVKDFKDLQKRSALVQISFDDNFSFWMKPNVMIRQPGTSVQFEVKLHTNSLQFEFRRLKPSSDGQIQLEIPDIVNPSILTPFSPFRVDIYAESKFVEGFQAQPVKYINKVARITVKNQFNQFIPGFYTSPFYLIRDTYFAYPVEVRILTDHHSIKADPPLIRLDPVPMELASTMFSPQTPLSPYFRLRIDKNTPHGTYALRFQVVEFNPVENYMKIERLEYEVTVPDSAYSTSKPKPFNGPIPEIRFSRRTYMAALGANTALEYVKLDPPSTEDFPLEIKTILPSQPDKVRIVPKQLSMLKDTGKSPFYITPLVGSVSGNLHMHIADVYYKNHILIREKKANLDVLHSEIEPDRINLLVDGRSAHGLSILPFDKEGISKAISRGKSQQLQVENQLELSLSHHAMVIFLFVHNTSHVATDRLLPKKLLDISPFDNNTIVDVGGQVYAYSVSPEPAEDKRGYSVSLGVARRELLQLTGYMIFVLIREGPSHFHILDASWRKAVNSNLKIQMLTLSAPSQFSQRAIENYLRSFSPLGDSLISSATHALTPHETPSKLVMDIPRRTNYSFIHFSSQNSSPASQLLSNTLLNEKNLPMLRYYLFLERNLPAVPSDWLRLESLSVVDLEKLHLDISIEDIDENFLHFGLSLDPSDLAPFAGSLDFAALVQLRRKEYDWSQDALTETHEAAAIIVFNASLKAEVKFRNLEKEQEFFLKAKPCVSYNGQVFCNTKSVGWLNFRPSQKR